MPTPIKLREKYRTPRHAKGTTAHDKGGHSGNGPHPARYRKKHLRSNGQPGSPQGTCLRPKSTAYCRCGSARGGVGHS